MQSLWFFLTIFASASALTFNCLFVEVQWMGIGRNYQCKTKPFSVNSSQYVTAVTGVHVANKTNNDVLAIHISNCTDLSYIPRGLLNIFPNLIAIYLQGCPISELSGTELSEYPLLKLFALERSPLKYIPGNLFANNPEIFFVSFTDNEINGVGAGLLSNLSKLTEVYFENNTCINANATISPKVTEFKEKLSQQCSMACEMCKSFALPFLLCGIGYLGTQFWIN